MQRDLSLLFASRAVRMYGFGAVSVILALYLQERGFNADTIGLLFTLALAGDALISVLVTSVADRVGRRRLLTLTSSLIALAGLGFLLTDQPLLLMLTAIVGTVSPNGGEVGPYGALEQASLSQITPQTVRTRTFGWYQMAGSLATAFGALTAGLGAQAWQSLGHGKLESYQIVLGVYAASGAVLALLFRNLSVAVEHRPAPGLAPRTGLGESRGVVMRLCALFALDSFGSSLVMQGLTALWMAQRFGASPATLGTIFFCSNLVAALSNPFAARLAERIGLVNTMVWTHIPANLFLIAFPFAPTLPWAFALLIARFSLSQMDVPARTAYTMSVVRPEERSATAGWAQQAKLVGNALGPVLTGAMLRAGWLSVPFVLGGSLKIAYDLALYAGFRSLKPREAEG